MAEANSFVLDLPTVASIAFALSFMPISHALSTRLIPSHQLRNRVLFAWHAYDSLTHLFIEASFLYECFFSYITVDEPIGAAAPTHSYFLGRKDRRYGAKYGTGPSARLWQEYAKADHRWDTTDTSIVSLELLTVFLGGPVSVYICYLLYKISSSKQPSSSSSSSKNDKDARQLGATKAKLWLLASALATAELYGGFVTFAPEWLSGNSQLDASNPVYLWFYLVFFNVIWVFIPLWVLTQAYKELKAAFVQAELVSSRSSDRKKA